MKDKVFFDTNIFIYAVDDTVEDKMMKSRSLLLKFSPKNQSIISFQVIQEFINTCLKKKFLITETEKFNFFIENELKSRWVINPTMEFYFQAINIKNQYKYSFYDSLIIAAALKAKCKILYSEDMQHNQKIDNLQILNPFAEI